ncbi:MAG: hypothetical protein J7639_14235 [Paenibacillaceae bacterium]|nr:hypothetical protein [Paenibacillaceae bacterium]
MKKLVNIVLAAVLTLAVWMPLTGPPVNADFESVYAQNFETIAVGQMPAGWTASTGANAVAVAESSGNGKYMASTETANSTANTATYAFTPSLAGTVAVEMRVLAKQTNAEAYFLVLKDGAGDKVIELLFDGSHISRRLAGNTKSWLQSYTANQWYQVKAVVDLAAHTYDVWIDSVQVVSAAPLLVNAAAIDMYSFSTYRYQAGTFYVDDLAVSADSGAEPPVNAAPTAGNVGISGTAETGNLLTGTYTYADAEADAQGTSVFQWYRATSADGSDRTAIAGATALTYTVTRADEGRYVLFGVTPVASTGTAQGAAAFSAPVRVLTTTYLAEDFQLTTTGQVPTGWTATTGANLVAVQDAGGNRYLATTENANSTANTATYTFGTAIAASFTANLRVFAAQTNAEGYFLTLKDGAGDKVIELLFDGNKLSRRVGSSGKSTLLGGYAANQWYDIRVDADMAAQTYSVSIDGTPIATATGVSLLKTASAIASYSFASYRYQSGTFGVDDLDIRSTEPQDPVNEPPSAADVGITGTAAVGQTLTGVYTYQDAEADAEGATGFQWYRASLPDGSDRTAIAGETALAHVVASADAGHYVLFEVTPVAAAGTTAGSAVLSAPVFVGVPAGTVNGSEAAFDANGRFTDDASGLSHVFSYRAVTASAGSITGIGGELAYYTSSAFKRAAIDVTYNKWALTFAAPDELQAYAATFDSPSGTFTGSVPITLVRKLSPDLMSGVQNVKATYESAALPSGTQYIRILLPAAGYFGSTGAAADFRIDTVTLDSASSETPGYDGYIVDRAADFSRFAAGTGTANLQAVALDPATSLSTIRTFGTTTYFKRVASTAASAEMIYRAPEGKDFKSAYMEGYYYQSLPGNAFEIWTSADGVTYTRYNAAGIYKHPAFGSSANNSIPDVLQANYLPDGVKYIQVRLPAVSGGFPYLTKLAFAYGPEVTAAPIDTDIVIRQASQPIAIDGVVPVDGSGNPLGEWAGSELIKIAGVVDNDGQRHSADVYMKYDAEHLYIAAKVKDPTPMKNVRTGASIWNGDVLELFIGDEDLDFTAYPDRTGTMLPSDRQIVLGSGVDYGYQSYMQTNGVNTFPTIFMEIKPDAGGKGYVMEAAIPLAALGFERPWEGAPLILNAVLSDGGYASRGQWGWTTTGEASKKSRGLWGNAAFELTSAPAADLAVTASVNNATQLVTVTGQTYGATQAFVGMTVTNPQGVVTHIDQTESDGSGHFTFQYTLHGDASANGTYTVSVGGEGVVLPQTATFTFTHE